MSQKENEIKEKKHLSFEKKLIIFVSVTIILIIAVTAILIVNTKDKKQNVEIEIVDKETKEEKKDDKKETKGANITDIYNTNAIKIEEKDYIIQRGSLSDEMKYIKIDGLKDENIEKSINDKIYNMVQNGYNEILEKGKKKYKEDKMKKMKIEGYSFVSFSGANVLSGYIGMDISKSDGSYDISEDYTFNISLLTGEDIKFLDLFSSDANIVSIAESSIYENLAWSYESEEGHDMDKIDYSSIEDKVFLYVQKFKEKVKKNELKFYVTSRYIYGMNLYSEKNFEGYMQIDMTKFVNYVSLYNLCSEKKNIYDDKYLSTKGLFIFEDDNVNVTYFEAKNEENYFLRLWLSSFFEEGDVNKVNADKLVEKYKEEIPKTIDKYKKEMGNKAVVVTSSVQIINNDSENVIEVQEYYDFYSVKKDFYKKTFYNLVRDSCQINMAEGSSLYINYYDKYEKQVKNRTVYIMKKYNPKTLKLVSKEISDSEKKDEKREKPEKKPKKNDNMENIINNNVIDENIVNNIVDNNVINSINTMPEENEETKNN